MANYDIGLLERQALIANSSKYDTLQTYYFSMYNFKTQKMSEKLYVKKLKEIIGEKKLWN